MRRWADGEPVEVTGSLVALMWAIVLEVVIDESTGDLTIRVEDGRRIDVGPDEDEDEDDEAWGYAGPNGYTVIRRPGGGLLVFGPFVPSDPPPTSTRTPTPGPRWSWPIRRHR